jgi:hypothetical protein
MPPVGPVAVGKKKLFFFGRVPRPYDLEDLLRASAEVLGKGTYGTTYKAALEIAPAVAVKRLKETSLPEREFRDKIAAIGGMDHPNVVPLQAYYFSKDERLMVYEFVSTGSLSSLLHGTCAHSSFCRQSGFLARLFEIQHQNSELLTNTIQATVAPGDRR